MGERIPFRPPERSGKFNIWPTRLVERLRNATAKDYVLGSLGMLAAAGVLGGLTGLGISDIIHNPALKAPSLLVLGTGVLSTSITIWGLHQAYPHPDDR